jgi:hypothetical protein
MEFLVSESACYLWTGPNGLGSDSIKLSKNTPCLILGTGYWINEGVTRPVWIVLHHDGIVAWTPMFRHFKEIVL